MMMSPLAFSAAQIRPSASNVNETGCSRSSATFRPTIVPRLGSVEGGDPLAGDGDSPGGETP